MAGTFPTLSSGSVALAPVNKSVSRLTRVLEFDDESEQRFSRSPLLASFELQFRGVKASDRDLIADFHEVQKGAFDSSWTFPFDAHSYTSMAFEEDEFRQTETRPGRWDLAFRIRQTKQSLSVPSVSAVYPTINGGVRTQRPFTRTARYRTSRNDMESGLRYAYSHRDDPLWSWTNSYPVITPTEAGTLLNFFVAMGGKYNTFSFTDPEDLSVHSNCRFGQDSITIQYVSVSHRSTTTTVEEFG